MSRYEVHVTIDADSLQDAINRIIYPEGMELQGLTRIWAEEEVTA